jgi:MIP family channel proteins
MNDTMRASLAELLGTFTLTFIGAGAIIANAAGGGGGLVAIALAHGLALSVAVYATGHISGGHINPAVTCAMFATKKIGGGKAIAYIIAQLLGATIAAIALKSLYPAAAVESAKLGATLGSLSAAEPMKTLVIEAFLTFLLVTTIFGVAVAKGGPKNVYGFAIGLTVCLDILAAGPLTGASMNPARSFGPALIGEHWDVHHVYWLGPILGGVVAGVVYQTFLLPKEERGG